jgi:hypothetical protein
MTDPIETLAVADPLRGSAPSAEQAARMDAGLRRLPALEETPVGAAPRARRRSARRWAPVPVVAAAAAAAMTLALPDRAPEVLRPEPANAATVLTQLGQKAAQAPVPSGRYAYVKQLSYVSHMRPRPSGKGTYVVVIPHETEQWTTDDGTAYSRWEMHEDQATYPTPEDEADARAASPPPLPADTSIRKREDTEIMGLTVEQIRALPTDPGALRARLDGRESKLTAIAGGLLSFAGTPQDVRVALFAVLKRLPEAALVPKVTDPLGRTGVGVRFDDPAWRTLFVFDPESGALLGTRSIGHKEVPGRDIDDWTLTVESTRTDALQTPAS